MPEIMFIICDKMEKFLMLGKYSAESMKAISAERTEKAMSIIK